MSSLHIIDSDHQEIDKAINADYFYKWTPARPVFISAQTGTGKNTFIGKLIENIMLKDEFRRTYSFLILTNRIALKRQQKQIFANHMLSILISIRDSIKKDREEGRKIGNEEKKRKYLEYLEELEENIEFIEDHHVRHLDRIENFVNVTIKSYHELWGEKSKLKLAKHYDFIIFDECHFFVADADFNKYTDRILYPILKTFPFSIRIYMTATPSEVVFPIMSVENLFNTVKNIEEATHLFEYEDNLSQIDKKKRSIEFLFNPLVLREGNSHERNYGLDNTLNLKRVIYKNDMSEMEIKYFSYKDYYEKYTLVNQNVCDEFKVCKKLKENTEYTPLTIHMVPADKKPFTEYKFDTYETYVQHDAVIYEMKRDYSYIDCRYLRNTKNKTQAENNDTQEEGKNIDQYRPLLNEIKKQIDDASAKNSEEEKWIIFVSSADLGIALLNAINSIKKGVTSDVNNTNIDKNAVYIDSKRLKDKVYAKKRDGSKDENNEDSEAVKAYEEIISYGKFSYKVLITTAVLDNGINIDDKQVKHIAIFDFDKVSFLQMLGRKRIDRKNIERITLYLREYKKSFFNPKRVEINKIFDSLSQKRKYGDHDILEEKFENDKIYYPSNNGSNHKLSYNEFTEIKLKYDRQFLGKILQKDLPDKLNTYDDYLYNERMKRINNSIEELRKNSKNLFSEEDINEQMNLLEQRKQLVSKINLIEKAYKSGDSFGKITVLEQLSWIDMESSFNEHNYLPEDTLDDMPNDAAKEKIDSRVVEVIKEYKLNPEIIFEGTDNCYRKGMHHIKQEKFREKFTKSYKAAYPNCPENDENNLSYGLDKIGKCLKKLKDCDPLYEYVLLSKSVKITKQLKEDLKIPNEVKEKDADTFWILTEKSRVPQHLIKETEC